MNIFKLILFVALFFAFTACKSKPALSANEAELVTKVLNENQKIHKTLFEHDTKIPSVVSIMKITIDAQEQSVNKDLSNKLTAIIRDLSGIDNNDRETFDNQYSEVSVKIADIIKTFQIKKFYEFYCPMEKKTCISTGFTIQNPYASDMRDCGEIVKD